MNEYLKSGEKTIAAVATALTNSGISVIRISGPQAFEITDKIFMCKGKMFKAEEVSSHTIHYGHIVDTDGNRIDEVLVLIFRAPSSYTKEDVVEIDCHGGVFVTKQILKTVLDAGAVMAAPGEFTERAFLNGRIDLSRAEAVADIINSSNEYALKNSVKQLSGTEEKNIDKLMNILIEDISFIEAAIDDPENYDAPGEAERIKANTEEIRNEVGKMLAAAGNGRILTEGIKTAIIGKTNAGKSTLLNTLLGCERAIVTDIEGTTRDTIEESINLDGLTLILTDTAGIRSADNEVEKIGIERSVSAARDADLILAVIDVTGTPDENDLKILDEIKGKNCIYVFNKTDLAKENEPETFAEEYFRKLREMNTGNTFETSRSDVVYISAKAGEGTEELSEIIKEMFEERLIMQDNEICITNIRHREALKEAADFLDSAKEGIEAGVPEDLYSVDLQNAYYALGKITGKTTDEDIINNIFSKFCLGK